MELGPGAVRRTIWLLSHVGSHPNIFVSRDTWIKPETEGLLLPTFRWSPEELAQLNTEFPALMHHEWFQGIAASLTESKDRLSLY